MSELEKLQRKINQLRVTNSGLMNEIEKYDGSLEISIARIEHFIGFLVAEGVLSEMKQCEEQEKWERSLRRQLIPVRDRLRETFFEKRDRLKKLAKQQAKAAAEPNEESVPKLIIPE